MMNITSLFILVGLFLGSVLCASSPQNVSKVERFIYDRCRVYSTEASSYDQVKEHLSTFIDYLRYTSSLLPKGKQQFCHDEKPTLIQSMGELARELKPCFPKTERYLPKFLNESFAEFLIFACSGNTIENFFSTQGSECRRTLKSRNAGEEVDICFRKLFAGFDDVVKKEDLCLDLKLAKTCFGDAIARHCPDFKGYESLNNKFFNAVRKPCNSAITFGVMGTVLIIVAFISTKIF